MGWVVTPPTPVAAEPVTGWDDSPTVVVPEPAQGWVAFAGAAVTVGSLDGDGELTAQFMKRGLVDVLLSGDGALAAMTQARDFRIGDLAGYGFLDAAMNARHYLPGAFAAEGELSVDLFLLVGEDIRPMFNGAGHLGTVVEVLPPPWDGLRATVSPLFATSASFSGGGTLTGYVFEIEGNAANFSGNGALTALAMPASGSVAGFSGTGSLAANVFLYKELLASLSGLGVFSGTAMPKFAVSAPLSGIGSLAAIPAPAYSILAALSGAGALSATVAAGVRATLGGDGALTAQMVPAGGSAANFSGSGALAATALRSAQIAAALSGVGVFSGTATAQFALPAVLSGVGTLGATVVQSYAWAAALSGTGTLAGAVSEIESSAANFSGDGSLSATALQISVQFGATAGTFDNATGTSLTWTHTPAVGDDFVLVDVLVRGDIAVSSVTYGGTAMALHAAQANDNLPAGGWLRRYVLFNIETLFGNVPQTVSVTKGAANAIGQSFSYSNCTFVGSPPQVVTGSVTSLTQTTTGMVPDGMVIQTYGGAGAVADFIASSGGTQRLLQNAASAVCMVTRDATVDTTFTATLSATERWTGMATILSPSVIPVFCAAALSGSGALSATATQVPFPTITNITTSPFLVGNTITVTGTGFVGVTGVTVGGVAATGVSVTNSTTLTCVIPSVALGAQNVIVTAASGASAPYAITIASPFTPFNEENTNRTNQAVPAGCTGVWVTLLGPGGNGGGGIASGSGIRGGGSGGGGGGRILRSFIAVANLGSTYSLTRGTASGTATVFSSGGKSCAANSGGNGGLGSSGIDTAPAAGTAGTTTVSGFTGIGTANGSLSGRGGTGTNLNNTVGANNTTGGGAGGGGGGGYGSNGSVGQNAARAGGTATFDALDGGGGTGTAPGGGNGGAGSIYGGGGGGGAAKNTATGNTTGGVGAAGYSLLEWV